MKVAFTAPKHPLEAELARKLEPAICEFSALGMSRRRYATLIARTVLEALERDHRDRLEGRKL